MKRIIAIVLALMLVFTLSTVAFAVVSPSNPDGNVNVTIISKPNARGTVTVKKIGDQTALSADSSAGTFNSWSFYTKEGKAAVLDTDYTIVNGKITDPDLVIKANIDIIACANYDGKITDPLTAEPKDPVSAKTGDTVVVFAVIALCSLAVVFGAKKQLSK